MLHDCEHLREESQAMEYLQDLIVYLLIRFSTPLWSTLISGAFILISLSLSFYLLFEHLSAYKNPEEQKFLIGVILMVPFYAVESFVSLLDPSISVDIEILRDCYESFAMYCFGRYLVACLDSVVFAVKLVVPKTPDGHGGVFLNTSYPLKQKELVEHGPCHRFGFHKCKGVLASFEIFNFVYLLVLTLLLMVSLFYVLFKGGEERTIEFLKREGRSSSEAPLLEHSNERGTIKHPFPMNYILKPWRLGQWFYQVVKFGIVQYMLIKSLTAVLAVILEAFGVYCEGDFKLRCG
ncbi:hypothetical protein POTOM_018065 [Populus tomentosa]|uniref:Uncharacterized protein n=1 Tax=Populus tomentosa TaxID=118781 RepID=A0A8X8A027_POPTO|nr:hypothetical protein POTOM_018065 [Populus tomentosa]